jgi:hypothetical protein
LFTGTLLTNLYFFQELDPVKVNTLLVKKGITSLLPAFIFASADDRGISSVPSLLGSLFKVKHEVSTQSEWMQLSTYAQARSLYGLGQSSCLERKGAELALHVNTLYMTVSDTIDYTKRRGTDLVS